MSDLREQLACLEHDQWMKWAKSILTSESISAERKQRWFGCFVHYSKLTEEMKDHDRVWADKVISIIEKSNSELWTKTTIAANWLAAGLIGFIIGSIL